MKKVKSRAEGRNRLVGKVLALHIQDMSLICRTHIQKPSVVVCAHDPSAQWRLENSRDLLANRCTQIRELHMEFHQVRLRGWCDGVRGK